MSISFGSGGGFTGAVNEYILNGKGQLFQIKPNSDDTVLLKKIDKKSIIKIFKLSESLKTIKLDEPSNMTSFIRIYKKGILIKYFQWPSGTMSLPKKLMDLDSMLKQII